MRGRRHVRLEALRATKKKTASKAAVQRKRRRRRACVRVADREPMVTYAKFLDIARDLEKMITLMGTPWDESCTTAKPEGVVIGAHGYGGLDRVLGTTASRVVNHADRSVLVVRGEPVHPG